MQQSWLYPKQIKARSEIQIKLHTLAVTETTLIQLAGKLRENRLSVSSQNASIRCAGALATKPSQAKPASESIQKLYSIYYLVTILWLYIFSVFLCH